MVWSPPRIVYQAHDSPGRLRLRLSWLHAERASAEPLADALAVLAGVEEVQVRPFTGSVLVRYDPAVTSAAILTEALLAHTGVSEVTRPGYESPEQVRAILHGSYRRGSTVARAAVRCFQGLGVDFLRLTGGRLSLGAATSLALSTTAAFRVLRSEELELPHWYQLAWWGFRSFIELEGDVVDGARERRLEELCVDAEPAAASGVPPDAVEHEPHH